MLKSTLFRRVFSIFFVLTFMISLFNMAVFPGTPASYYVGLVCKMLFISMLNGIYQYVKWYVFRNNNLFDCQFS